MLKAKLVLLPNRLLDPNIMHQEGRTKQYTKVLSDLLRTSLPCERTPPPPPNLFAPPPPPPRRPS
jgi:hypothetical protein